MDFGKDTYIVLDIPEPFSSKIIDLRKNYHDEFRAALPTEITVAGSSGCGPISKDENLENVITILDKLLLELKPFEVQFSNIVRYPNSDVFAFEPIDKKPFQDIHNKMLKIIN